MSRKRVRAEAIRSAATWSKGQARVEIVHQPVEAAVKDLDPGAAGAHGDGFDDVAFPGAVVPGKAMHSAVPEEVQGGADLFVQCVAQPAIRAKTIVSYYRSPRSTVYNAVAMDPTKRGWSLAVIRANKLNGKLL